MLWLFMNQSTLMKAWNVIKILQTRVSSMANEPDFASESLDMDFCFGFWNKPHYIWGKSEES